MSREIKFRAWDKKYNLMERGLFGIRSDGLVSSNSGPDNVVLMQFTGLKDAKGQDIYEGDVLSFLANREPHVVEFRNGAFMVDGFKGGLTNDGYYYLGNCRVDVCEVIGNIYENPELLKEAR